jgi:Fe-S cluster assembly protein SufD
MTQAADQLTAVPVRDFGWPDFAAARPAREARFLVDLRRGGMTRFLEMGGLPSVQDEEWRQTPVGAIARTTFQRPGEEGTIRPETLAPLSFGHAFDGHTIVFVNGRYAPSLSSLGAQDGVRIESLARVVDREPALVENRLGRILTAGNSFAALNSAFIEDGAVILVPPGVALSEPIHVVHHATAAGGAPVSHPRLLIVAGRNSQATVVESFAGPDGVPYLTNAVAEVVLEDGAILDHYKVQREGTAAFHIATLAVRQGRDTHFSSHSIALGAAIARQEVDQVFQGQGGECTLGGLFLATGTQLTDTHTRIDHAVPHCSSRQLYKGIMDGQARGVFVGRVVVAKNAQKTDAQQTNKNLLLSRNALVHSVPQLEILADDVKCKHGSTTGQLDATALFYLRSRGIGEDAARSLLVYAFASDVIARIKVEALRAGLGRFLRERLPSAADIEEALV